MATRNWNIHIPVSFESAMYCRSCFQNASGFTLPATLVLRKEFSHFKVYKSHVKSGIPVAVGVKKIPKD